MRPDRASRRIARARPRETPLRSEAEARSTAPRSRVTRLRGGRGVAELKWAIRRLAERDGRSRSRCCESALDAFTLAVQCGGCGVSVVRQGPRARFRRAALASVAVRPHGQGVPPAPLATPRAMARRHHQYRGVPRLPLGPREVPRGSRLAVWLERARLRFGVARRAWGGASARETSRLIAIRHLIAPFGAHVGVSRPRCLWQPCGGGTIPPRHESLTSFSVSTTLAATGPKAAFAACHYPVRANPHPQRLPGSDRRHARLEPHPSPRRRNNPRGASRRARPCARPGLGPDLAKPTAWAALAPSRSQRSFVQPVSIAPCSGGAVPPEGSRRVASR